MGGGGRSTWDGMVPARRGPGGRRGQSNNKMQSRGEVSLTPAHPSLTVFHALRYRLGLVLEASIAVHVQ